MSSDHSKSLNDNQSQSSVQKTLDQVKRLHIDVDRIRAESKALEDLRESFDRMIEEEDASRAREE